MSFVSETEVLRIAIETLREKTRGPNVKGTIILDREGNPKSAEYVKGRTSIKIEAVACDGEVDIKVSPPTPWRCLLADPDSTRRTEMYYGPRKFVSAHVVLDPYARGHPHHINFGIHAMQRADAACIVARIAERF